MVHSKVVKQLMDHNTLGETGQLWGSNLNVELMLAFARSQEAKVSKTARLGAVYLHPVLVSSCGWSELDTGGLFYGIKGDSNDSSLLSIEATTIDRGS